MDSHCPRVPDKVVGVRAANVLARCGSHGRRRPKVGCQRQPYLNGGWQWPFVWFFDIGRAKARAELKSEKRPNLGLAIAGKRKRRALVWLVSTHRDRVSALWWMAANIRTGFFQTNPILKALQRLGALGFRWTNGPKTARQRSLILNRI